MNDARRPDRKPAAAVDPRTIPPEVVQAVLDNLLTRQEVASRKGAGSGHTVRSWEGRYGIQPALVKPSGVLFWWPSVEEFTPPRPGRPPRKAGDSPR
jgi:hypothetical protein